MRALSEHDLLVALAALALLLLAGRGTAELARRWKQPEVLGELFGGFLIGPSVLGAIFPGYFHALFENVAVGTALSLFSWMGAILLLLIAGIEADLHILREKFRPGLLAAMGAIVPSVLLGTWFGHRVLKHDFGSSFFLGLVLSVTAVSVVAKLLIEAGTIRRGYAQVMLAAGIAGEVLVWPLISVTAALRNQGSPVFDGLRAAMLATAFFAFMLTLGRKFTFWAMRRVADLTNIVNGELSLVLLLACVSAAITSGLGLHGLLGAFVFGVLLSRAPRATLQLKERVQSLAIGFFAPIFFVLAGMRVDVFQLRSMVSLGHVLLLFLLASLIKAGFGTVGARLGRLTGWESLNVGVGLNLKGGSDVVVAILGVELGLLSPTTYTMYAVVSMLTVLVTPPALTWLARKAAPSTEELQRLDREEAKRRAYLADMERVLVPVFPDLLPRLAAQVVQAIAATKQQEGEICDITELKSDEDESFLARRTPSDLVHALGALAAASEHEHVELQSSYVKAEEDVLKAILEAAEAHQIVAFGARSPRVETTVSFGRLQDEIMRRSKLDVLIAVHDGATFPDVRRVLVPVNGLAHSLAAADVAAYIAKAWNAEVVLLNVMQARLDEMFWREREHPRLLQAGYAIVREARFRIGRLGVRTTERVELEMDAPAAVLKELARRPYQLVVLGAMARNTEGGVSMGSMVRTVLSQTRVPRLLLLSRGAE